jgi:hypothetical protein
MTQNAALPMTLLFGHRRARRLLERSSDEAGDGAWTMYSTAMRHLVAVVSLVLLAGFISCDGSEDCSNGECLCEAGASCEFTCDAPPCHVICADGSMVCGVPCS